MKTLLTLFVLLFSSSLYADDISDFEIEGMSIGDSLLDYFDEKKLDTNKLIPHFKMFDLLVASRFCSGNTHQTL